MPAARCWLPSLLSLAVLAGCAKGPAKPDPAVVEATRAKFVLEVEPGDRQLTPLDWREEQSGEGPVDVLATVDPSEEADAAAEPSNRVVLVGQVGGMPNPWGAETEPDFPWKAGQATFFLVDPATADEFASHSEEAGDDHAADCPFCARDAASKANAVAVVSFPSEADPTTPVAIDARDLFGIKQGDMVVVRGEAELVGDVLVVTADGIFRRI
ncbi:MAG: hypothetical protein AAF266_15750 [Planctomycetota bacterium]